MNKYKDIFKEIKQKEKEIKEYLLNDSEFIKESISKREASIFLKIFSAIAEESYFAEQNKQEDNKIFSNFIKFLDNLSRLNYLQNIDIASFRLDYFYENDKNRDLKEISEEIKEYYADLESAYISFKYNCYDFSRAIKNL